MRVRITWAVQRHLLLQGEIYSHRHLGWAGTDAEPLESLFCSIASLRNTSQGMRECTFPKVRLTFPSSLWKPREFLKDIQYHSLARNFQIIFVSVTMDRMFFKTTTDFLKAPIHCLNRNLLASALTVIIIILILIIGVWKLESKLKVTQVFFT